MNTRVKLVLIGIVAVSAFVFGYYWIDTQPVWTTANSFPEDELTQLPASNQNIIRHVETHGRSIAYSYEEKVCTEFVIDVIENFTHLSPSEKNKISIITDRNVEELIGQSSPVVTGVQAALAEHDKGERVESPDAVKPGDFVQFWNLYNGKAYGHCGVVMRIDAGRTLTVYSSHPVTNGYGKQTWLWPEYEYFVRLH